MGRILKLLVGLLVVVAVLVGGVVFYLDTIARWALETGAEAALGVECSVGSVSIRPLRGQLRIRNLAIANPSGFEAPHFLKLREARAGLDIGSLRRDPIVVSGVALEGIDLALELQGRKTNYGAILKNIGGGGAAAREEPAASGEGGRSVRVDELVIREIAAKARLGGIPGGGREVTVSVPEVRLRNLGTGDSGGIALGDLISRVVQALLDAVLKEKELPTQLLSDLGQQLRDTRRLRGELEEQLGRAGGGLGEGAKGLVEGIGGLFGGKKEER